MTELAERTESGQPLLASTDGVDLAPLGVIERAEVKALVLDDTGRVELAGERMVGTSAARATAWVVFTRHRLTCPGGTDPVACGCGSEPEAYHPYLAGPDVEEALPVRPDLPLPPRQCKDCPEGKAKPITKRGRCATHYRKWRKQHTEKAYARNVRKYGITIDDYWRIYEAQGGRCAICQIATGAARRLSVDHDHETGEVRGLLCGPCNRFLAWVKNSTEAFARGLGYFIDPPARAVLPPRDGVDAPPLSDEERAAAVTAAAQQAVRRRHTHEPAGGAA